MAARTRAAARQHRDRRPFRIGRVDGRKPMTILAAQLGVAEPFVAELAGLAAAPAVKVRAVVDAHRRGKLWIEVGVRLALRGDVSRRHQLVTSAAIFRRGRHIFGVTGEAGGVARRRRLVRSFLQPEVGFGQALRRPGHVLVVGIALRLIGLVTVGAHRVLVFGLLLCGLRFVLMISGQHKARRGVAFAIPFTLTRLA